MRFSPSALVLVALMGVASIGLIGVGVGATLTDTVQATQNISTGQVQWQINRAWWFDFLEPNAQFHEITNTISPDGHSVEMNFKGVGSDLDKILYVRLKNTGTLPIAWEELTLSGRDHNTLARSLGVLDYTFENSNFVIFLNGQRLDQAEGMGEGNAGQDKHALKPGETADYALEIFTDFNDQGANPLPPGAHNQTISATLTAVAGDSIATPPSAAPTTGAPANLSKTPPVPN